MNTLKSRLFRIGLYQELVLGLIFTAISGLFLYYGIWLKEERLLKTILISSGCALVAGLFSREKIWLLQPVSFLVSLIFLIISIQHPNLWVDSFLYANYVISAIFTGLFMQRKPIERQDFHSKTYGNYTPENDPTQQFWMN